MAEDKIDSVVDNAAVQAELNKLHDFLQKVVDKIKEINTAGGQINLKGGLSAATLAAQQARAATEELKKARADLQKQEAEIRRAAAAAAAQQARIDAANNASSQQNINNSRQQREAANALAAQQRQAVAAQQAAERAAARAARTGRNEQNAAAGSLDQLRAKLRRITAEYDAMGAAQRRSASGHELQRNIRELITEVNNLENATGRFQRRVGDYRNRIVGGLGNALGLIGIAGGLGATANSIFETTVRLDSLEAGLRAVSKSTGDFILNQAFLTKISDRLGLKLEDVTKAYKLFYASSTLAGLSSKQTREIFEAAAEAGANLKLSGDDMNGVLLAFSQILGKGKVQAEELRGQIGERLPGAFSIAARAIGKTEAELNKMLEKGEVISSDFMPKFAAELKKTFGNGGTEVKGLQAELNRLSNEFTSLVSDNQSGLNAFFASIVYGAKSALTGFSKLVDAFRNSGFAENKAELSAADLAELAGRSPIVAGKDNVPFKTGFLKAIAAKQAEQGPALADFAAKNAQDQVKSIRELTTAYESLKKETEGYRRRNQQETEEAIKATLAYEGYAFRLKEYYKIFLDGRRKTVTQAAKPTSEAELNKAAMLQDRLVKANFEGAKFELSTQIEIQKEIVDNDKASFAERMMAAENYQQLKEKLAELEAQADKDRLDIKIGRSKASAKEEENIDKKLTYDKAKIQREASELTAKIVKDNADDKTQSILSAYAIEKQGVEKQADEEVEALQARYTSGLVNKDEYEAQKLAITNKYAKLGLEAEIRSLEAAQEIARQLGLPTEDTEAKILAAKNKIRDIDLKYFEDTESKKTKAETEAQKQREELRKKEIEGVKTLTREAAAAITALFTGNLEAQKNAVQEQIDLLDEATQKEIEGVNDSTASAEEKAAKIQLINARADAQKNQLEKRQRQIENEKAKFERLKNIGQIIAGTAVNIVKVFPNPVLIALAAATGAAQLAQVLATPLPKYRMGTEDHPGGPAMVNDGGAIEPLEAPDGRVYMAKGKDAIVNMPAHWKVHKNMSEYFNKTGADMKSIRMIPNRDGVWQLASTMSNNSKRQTKQLLAGLEANKTVVKISNTSDGLKASAKRGQAIIDFYNREIKF